MSNKMDRPLVTVDGRTLMDRPLEPPNFVVDTLISQGLHILAGSPKVGKSWLALWLAVTVAKGEPVWGMSVKQGTTLYLCLEDSVLRIQNRLFEITEDAPDSVHFCTECAPIGQGLEEQVEGFLVAHPDTVLVLVDTLQMVRPVHDATYANDYRDLSVLKRLADKHGIAILLIEHDMSLVMSVCQRIQVLDYGRTIASGTPEQIANNPQVISAYLGSDSNDDADGDSTAKVEPEPSVAKTIQEEGAR